MGTKGAAEYLQKLTGERWAVVQELDHIVELRSKLSKQSSMTEVEYQIFLDMQMDFTKLTNRKWELEKEIEELTGAIEDFHFNGTGERI